MTGNDILRSQLIDILFDDRNKQYGAYVLRKYYNSRLLLSLGLSLSTVLLLFIFAGNGRNNSITVRPVDTVVIRSVAIPEKKEVKIERPKPVMAPKAASAPREKYVTRINIVDDDKLLKQDFARNDKLANALISDVTTVGIPGAPKVPQVINTSGGDGQGNKGETSAAPLINRSPEFPGGMQAWIRFLNWNLHVPDEMEPGEKTTVVIRFEVAVDGTVTGFIVQQSAGRYYDQEVIRVLKKMPKWKPALQNSQPVAVTFSQPVTFMSVSE